MTTEFDEETVIAQVTERLVERFPDAEAGHIETLVRKEVGDLANRPVQDYIAVLGERAVKKQLKSERNG